MNVQREQLFRFFFLGVFLYLLFEFLKILSPFMTGILGAIILTLIFYPLHRVISNFFGNRRENWAAFATTFLVMVLIVIPFIFFSWLLLNEVTALIPVIKKFGSTLEKWRHGDTSVDVTWLKGLEMKLRSVIDIPQVNLQKMLTNMANSIVHAILNVGKRFPRNAFIFVINFAGMVFTLFFLFRDGVVMFERVKELVPMEKKHKDHIAEQLYLTVTAVVRGVFIVAAVQGATAGIGYYGAGLIFDRMPSALVLGFATMFTALIPFVGAGAIWLPVSIYYLVQGVFWQGIVLMLWGFFVVSTVDNFLRPYVIGNRAKLPMLFLFLGILGGLKMYGPMGVFLGPLVVALLTAFIEIYRQDYR